MITRRALLLSTAAAVAVPALPPNNEILAIPSVGCVNRGLYVEMSRQMFYFGGDGIVRWSEPSDPTTWGEA